MPDAFGYSVELGASGTLGPLTGSAKTALNFTKFTRGEYAYQSFLYEYHGWSAGAGKSSGVSANGTVMVSPFVAWFTKAPRDGEKGDYFSLTPFSWNGDFDNLSASGKAGAGFGGAIGGTYFEGKPFDREKGGWWGFSLDISGTLGGGASTSLQAGTTTFNLLEKYPTKTTAIDINRMTFKSMEYSSMGVYPGTYLSDKAVELKVKINSSKNELNDFKDRAIRWWEDVWDF